MKLLAELTDKSVSKENIEFFGEYKIRKAVRAILFNDKNEIALLYSPKYEFHKLPGGGIEPKENMKSALKREIKEETGCEIKIEKEIGKISEIKDKHGQKQISYCYFATVTKFSYNLNLTKEEKEELGIKLFWTSLKNAVKLFEKDDPEDYTAKFIVKRDIIFLNEALKSIYK